MHQALKVDYPTPEGELLGILPSYIFLRVEKDLLRADNMVCTTQGHGFISHIRQKVHLRLFTRLNETFNLSQDRSHDYGQLDEAY